MPQERTGLYAFKGKPLTLVGTPLKVGDQAPGFKALAKDLSEFDFASTKGRIRLISAVPSLDTGICSETTKRFNQEAAQLPSDVEIVTLSMDLPFAQGRFCKENAIERVKTLSDHRDAAFGLAYGVLVKELRLLARSIWVVDARDNIVYFEIVKELASHPDYDAALDAVRKAAEKVAR